MTEREYTDYASVRDALLSAQERRGFLSYEQKLALQHAEWAASDQRGDLCPERALPCCLEIHAQAFDDHEDRLACFQRKPVEADLLDVAGDQVQVGAQGDLLTFD